MKDLSDLIERVSKCTEADNALDVEIEVALFTPDARHVSVKANAAGTKCIYTRHEGGTDTHWAFDYTLNIDTRADALVALELLEPAK